MAADTLARALAFRANQSSTAFTKSLAAASASFIPSDINHIRTTSYAVPGDLGGALYKRVSSAPTHAGKFQSTDGAWWELAETVVTPQMFGAKGDCVYDFTTNTATGTDDTVAVQAAYDYFQLQGIGGRVEFSRLHRISGKTNLTGITVGIEQWGDNIASVRRGSGLLGMCFDGNVTGFDRGLHISGGRKTGNPDATANRCIDKAGYAIAGSYAKGVKSITLATAAHAANFTRGDVAFLRTGQCLVTGLTEPDSELLIVRSADAGTGLVTFETRTSAPYAQERFVAGSTGRTTSGISTAVTVGAGGTGYVQGTTTVSFSGGGSHPNLRLPTATATVSGGAVTGITITDPGEYLDTLPTITINGAGTGATGWAATFGSNARYELVNVTDRVLRNAFLDIDLIANTLGQCLNIWGCMGVTVAPTARIWTGYCGAGGRDSSEVKWGASIYATGRVNGNYLLGPSTGCSNWDINAFMRSNVWGYMHLHEGTKNIRLNLDLAAVGNGGIGEGLPLVSLGSRNYETFITGSFDSGDADNACIGADESCRGGITFGPLDLVSNRPNTTGAALSLGNNPNVIFTAEPAIRGNTNRLSLSGGLSAARTTLFGVKFPTRVVAPFQFDKGCEFFDIGIDEEILEVRIQINTAFATGNRVLNIGYAVLPTAFLNAFVLSGLAVDNLSIVRPGDARAGSRLGLAATAKRTVVATLSGGTTDFTAGQARIALVLGRAARF